MDQMELALYDREGIIVDELIGLALVPHQRVSPSSDLVDAWIPIQSTSKQFAPSSSAASPTATPEMCVTMRFIDSETKASVEALQRAKTDSHQRRKEMRKLFNIDEEYLYDFSCNLDRGTIPGFGRVYITSTHLLYNSTFKQKVIAIEDIRVIEKYKTLLLANAGIALQMRNGRKIQLKSFKHRKTFVAALQQQAKNLGLPPINIIDRESSEDHSGDQDSDEETDSSSITRTAQDMPTSPLQDPHSTSPSNGSPIPPSDMPLTIVPAPTTSSTSPPSSMKRSNSSKLRDSGEIEKGDKKEKDAHRRTPSTMAASIVKTVSDKLRNISASSSVIAHPKAEPSASTSTPPMLSVTSDSISHIAGSRSSTTSQPSFSAALASSASQLPVLQTTTHAQPISHSASLIQAPVKSKEKTSSFLKDFSLPFHLPGSKRKHNSGNAAPSHPQHMVQAESAPITMTNALADDSLSSSDEERSADSVREREQSRRLKYYLIHGEAPIGSGEDESEQMLPRKRKGSRKAVDPELKSSPNSLQHTPQPISHPSSSQLGEDPPSTGATTSGTPTRSLRQATHSLRRSSDAIIFDEHTASDLDPKSGQRVSKGSGEMEERSDADALASKSDESDSSESEQESLARIMSDSSNEKTAMADSSSAAVMTAGAVTTSSSDLILPPIDKAPHKNTLALIHATVGKSCEGIERDDSSSCESFFSPRGDSSATPAAAAVQYWMPIPASQQSHPLAMSAAAVSTSNVSTSAPQHSASQLQQRILSSSWDIPSHSTQTSVIHPLLHLNAANSPQLAPSSHQPPSLRSTATDSNSLHVYAGVQPVALPSLNNPGQKASWDRFLEDSDRSEDVDVTPRNQAGSTQFTTQIANAQTRATTGTTGTAASGGAVPVTSSTSVSLATQSPSKSIDSKTKRKVGARDRRSSGSAYEASQMSSTSSSSSSDDSIAGSTDQSASSPIRPRRASAGIGTSGSIVSSSIAPTASLPRPIAPAPSKPSSVPPSSSFSATIISETSSSAMPRSTSSKSISVPPLSTKSHQRKHSQHQYQRNQVEQTSKRNLSSVLVKTGVFSFCLALAILLRHSTPLSNHINHATDQSYQSYQQQHQQQQQATNAKMWSGSYFELLGFATTAAIGSIVSQLLMFSFSGRNTVASASTHTASPRTAGSPSPRSSTPSQTSQVPSFASKSSSSSLSSSKSSVKNSTSANSTKTSSSSSSTSSHKRNKSNTSSSSSSSNLHPSPRSASVEDGDREKGGAQTVASSLSDDRAAMPAPVHLSAPAPISTVTGPTTLNSQPDRGRQSFIFKEHLTPLLTLIAGHTIVLLTGFVISTMANFIGSSNSAFKASSGILATASYADFSASLSLLSPKTCILYVLFSSIGCHMIAKWQATTED